MDRATFESKLRALLAGHARSTGNRGCVACADCERCADCTFCERSTGLVRAHYCKDSHGCTDSSHLVRCKGCLASQHLTDSEDCTQSAYLFRCTALSGCTYCFGCVGLTRKDFHVLNEPYDRQTYFEVTARLLRELK